MLPYPSGEPHIGHLKCYSLGDAIAHFHRRLGQTRAAPDGLRRVRAAGREPRDQDRRAPARLDGGIDRRLPAAVPRVGDLDRLVARARDLRTRATTAGRSGSSSSCSRAGLAYRARRPSSGARTTRRCSPTSRSMRRPLRALRRDRRGAPARAVVPAHHRLRRAAARPTSTSSTGPSTSRRCSATGSGAARAPR